MVLSSPVWSLSAVCQVLDDRKQWWKVCNGAGAAGYVPNNILAVIKAVDVTGTAEPIYSHTIQVTHLWARTQAADCTFTHELSPLSLTEAHDAKEGVWVVQGTKGRDEWIWCSTLREHFHILGKRFWQTHEVTIHLLSLPINSFISDIVAVCSRVTVA